MQGGISVKPALRHLAPDLDLDSVVRCDARVASDDFEDLKALDGYWSSLGDL